jgi:hypothetical protein
MHESQYAQYSPEYRAEALGREHGQAAASWVTDGNTDQATYARLLRGITDGDPEVLDSIRTPDLSGEYADDYSEADMLADAGWVPHDGTALADDLAAIYLDTVSAAFWAEVERACRLHVVSSFRCPCCGDDVVSTGPPCDDCQAAGCEQTASG